MASSAGRRAWAAGLAALATVTTVAGAGRACVPQPFITISPQASGAAGTQVNVDGHLFPGNARIEVRWNRTDGTLLATAQTTDFSVPITVPDVPAGLYTVLAIARNPGGVQGEVARSEFQVTGTASTSTTVAALPARQAGTGEVAFGSVAAAVGLVAVGLIGGLLLGGRIARRRAGSAG